MMKRTLFAIFLLVMLFAARPAAAANTQLLVQSNLSTGGMNLVCLLRGCTLTQAVPGSPANYFVLSVSSSTNTSFLVSVLERLPAILNVTILGNTGNPLGNRYIVRTSGGLLNLPILCKLLLAILRAVPGVLNVELDQLVSLSTGSAQADAPPPSLVDTTPVPYYGSTVWRGYVNQPATQIIRLSQAQQQFNVSGGGIIADIDTGVDPNHPVLQPVLLPGYDFIRNQPGASEMNDLPSGTPVPENACDNCEPGQVNQHSIAMVDQHSIAMVDGDGYQD